LAGDADTVTEPGSHAAGSEALKGIFFLPSFFADKVGACHGTTPAFTRFAMYHGDSLLGFLYTLLLLV
jgi:hypothetical protein